MRDPLEGIAPDGTIRTGIGRDRVPPAYEDLIRELVDAFAAIGTTAAELFVYGSVATGMARPGYSDVDLLAVDCPPDWVASTADLLSRRYSDLCRSVEIGSLAAASLAMDTDASYGDRVFLRHYCVPLAGPDRLSARLPFAADARAARGFNGDIAQCLDRWRAHGATAQKIARKTLVAAAGIVSVRTGGWTTDRATAVESWHLVDESEVAAMSRLLEWAEGVQVASSDDVATALADGGIVSSVTDRFAADIGLWRPAETA